MVHYIDIHEIPGFLSLVKFVFLFYLVDLDVVMLETVIVIFNVVKAQVYVLTHNVLTYNI